MALSAVWLVVGLLMLAIPLVALARRANVAYPIVLVLGGLVLGFVPGLPNVRLEPDLVLVIFLPPLLYWESITAPSDVIRANAGQVWILAVGLVAATTLTVAVVAHLAISGLAWPMAFVLGAILAPTDELASAPVLERMRMPRHLIAIVEGESLLNDASSLILYAAAIGVAATGTFHFGRALLGFGVSAVGGIVAGIVLARIAVFGWRWIRDTELQSVISFNLPYATYIVAQALGLSGVLAVVYAGTTANRFTPLVLTPSTRIQVSGYWNTVVFLANVVLFSLVGLQLHDVARDVLHAYSWQTVLWYAFLVNATVIGTRFAWLLAQEFIPGAGAAFEHPDPDWKHALIAAWSGLRGAVSLAAALAIPVSAASGIPIEQRHLVIFLTFSVILVTLVGGGLTLPLLIRALGVREETSEDESEVRSALVAMSQAALRRLDELVAAGTFSAEEAQRLRSFYTHKAEHVDHNADDEQDALDGETALIEAERGALVELRRRGAIDNTVLRRLQHKLDIAEVRLMSHR